MRLASLALAAPIATLGAVALAAPQAEPVRESITQPKDAGAPAPSLPGCIAVRAEARYIVAGYKHIVVVTNGCSKNAICSVATTVNPVAQTVEVSRNATVEVVTFLESPASAFTPVVSCKLV